VALWESNWHFNIAGIYIGLFPNGLFSQIDESKHVTGFKNDGSEQQESKTILFYDCYQTCASERLNSIITVAGTAECHAHHRFNLWFEYIYAIPKHMFDNSHKIRLSFDSCCSDPIHFEACNMLALVIWLNKPFGEKANVNAGNIKCQLLSHNATGKILSHKPNTKIMAAPVTNPGNETPNVDRLMHSTSQTDPCLEEARAPNVTPNTRAISRAKDRAPRILEMHQTICSFTNGQHIYTKFPDRLV